MDKFAAAVPVWEKLGFGFCELGGVTWHAQPGNPQPRMFRAVADEAIVNRMGFNNPGAEAVAQKLADWKKSRPLAEASRRHQPRQIQNHAAGKSRRRLCEFIPRLARSRGFFCRQRQFAEHAGPAPVAGQSRAGRNSCGDSGIRIQRSQQSRFWSKSRRILSFEALDEILELVVAATNRRHRRDEHDHCAPANK